MIKPPRLDGRSVGVFATRSPMRPNPIGMSLAKLEGVEGNLLFVSGIDLVDGCYDDPNSFPKQFDEPQTVSCQPVSPFEAVEVSTSDIEFTASCLKALEQFHARNPDHSSCNHCLELMSSAEDVKSAIVNILRNDPRSRYRKDKCSDRMYFFTIDKIHVTTWFDTESGTVHVLKVKREVSAAPT